MPCSQVFTVFGNALSSAFTQGKKYIRITINGGKYRDFELFTAGMDALIGSISANNKFFVSYENDPFPRGKWDCSEIQDIQAV